MGSSSDDFGALQALLKVKRYEQPPPRYFDHLADGIHDRLRGPEGLRHKSLLSMLGLDFGLKQSLFYGLGVACCVLVFYSAGYLMLHGPNPADPAAQTANSVLPAGLGVSTPSTAHLLSTEPPETAGGVSTNPVLNPGGVDFPVEIPRPRPTPVSFGAPK